MSSHLSVQSASEATTGLSRAGDPAGGPTPPGEPLLALDEFLGAGRDVEFSPAGDVGEATTTATTDTTLAEYTVPADRGAILKEVAMESDANGTVEAWVGGQQFGPLSGSLDLTLPFDHAKLPSGATVKVIGSSTSGTETTVRGSIVALEV